MTPEELDDIERAYVDHAPECPFPGEKVIDALREAWAEVERMRRGEVDGIFTSVVHECCTRVQEAEAAIQRVRAQLESDVAYYGSDQSGDPMSMGREMGAREALRALDGER